MTITKKLSLVAVIVAAVLAAGVAFASWTSGGGGHGTAKARTAVALSTIAVPASSAGLYPGADAKVTIRIVNDNDFPVRITDVAYGAPATTTVTGALGACADGRDAALTFTDQSGLALEVAAHASGTFDVDGVHMGAASADGCQAATFTIPVSLTGASNAAQ